MEKNKKMSPFGRKKLINKLIFVSLVAFTFVFASPTLAATPTLSVYSTGSGDNVTISVNNANANSQVQLFFNPSDSSLYTQISNFGTTDYSGNFTTTVSAGSYGLSAGSQIYVAVGGIQSNIAQFGNNNCSYYGCGRNLSLSQTNVSLTVGQNMSITANNASNIYISNNTNSSVVSATVSGNQINLYGMLNGNSTVTVCGGYNSQCASIYVSVSGSGNVGGITFSQNNVNLNVGQNTTVSISAPYLFSGSYYISSNSNSYIADVYVSGSILYITGRNSGNTTIRVCQNNYSNCGSVYVTVGGGNYSGGSLYFSNTTLPTMVIGQYYSYQLQVSGGTPPYNFSLVSGNLPAGLSLNVNGTISGVPQYNASASFMVRVNDNFNRSATANITVSGSGYGYYPGGGLVYPGGSVAGASAYLNCQLIKQGNTVYIVYKNTKTGFASASAFTSLGFKFGNVLEVSNAGLNDSGYTVNSGNASHPWGSWLISGQAVYFVHESGLIPVPDWNTFINNNGQAAWIVPANLADFSLPMLTPMAYSDSRLM